jgi:hypothetical protein
MTKVLRTTLAIVLLSGGWLWAGSGALAQNETPRRSLKERQAIAAADARFKQELDSVNQGTGLKLSARIDWSGFTSTDFDSNNSLHGWCQTPLDVVRALATASDGGIAKTAVQEQVQEVVCRRGAQRTMSIENGVATFTITFDSSNDYDFVMKVFKDKL